jgi:hypothetical protein
LYRGSSSSNSYCVFSINWSSQHAFSGLPFDSSDSPCVLSPACFLICLLVDSVLLARIVFMRVGWNARNSWDDYRSWTSWHADASSHSASSNADGNTWNWKDDWQSECSTATMSSSTLCVVSVQYALSGEMLGKFEISSRGTVSELRIAVQRSLGSDYVELLWDGQILCDGKALLSDMGIIHGSHVQAVLLFYPQCFHSHFKYKHVRREIPAAYVDAYKLFGVASAGCIDCTRYLIEDGGVDVNSFSMNQKYTALDWAKYNGHASLVEYLISRGGVSHDDLVWQRIQRFLASFE